MVIPGVSDFVLTFGKLQGFVAILRGISADRTILIYLVHGDDNDFGKTPVCKECIWEVGRNNEDEAMCRITQDGSVRYCFTWDDDV